MGLLAFLDQTQLGTGLGQKGEGVVIGRDVFLEHLAAVEGDSLLRVVAIQEATDDGVADEGVGLVKAGKKRKGAADGSRGAAELLDGAAGGEGVLGEAGDDELGVDLVELAEGSAAAGL